MSDPHPALTTLLQRLRETARYPHPVQQVELLETHISAVLLAGAFAYKLKKPYDLGFLDFTTLAARRHFCEEELRLNRRFAPDLYLALIPITGSVDDPNLGGPGEAIEYAVKMRRFDQDALLTSAIARGALQPAHLDAFAAQLASFHDTAAQAMATDRYGEPEVIHAAAIENFEQMRPLLTAPLAARLDALSHWTQRIFEKDRPRFLARKRAGGVRECHGDLHLGNLILLDEKITAFDCIEFNEAFRWIDVMSEVAFLVMDLCSRNHPELGFRFLNAYLEHSGDFDGLAVLDFYLVFRALVRAKIALFRATQADTPAAARPQSWAEFEHYLGLAERFVDSHAPQLILMHGFSGSGKSTVARVLAARLPAIHIRSDVERKRLFGLSPLAQSQSAVSAGIYTADASRRTCDRLLELARALLQAGWPVIVDATFLSRDWRAPFIALANELSLRWRIVDCIATPDTLRARVAARKASGQDAAEADLDVLEKQLASHEPFTNDENARAMRVDTEQNWQADGLAAQLS